LKWLDAFILAATALLLGAGPALAKKQLVIVVKGLDNPFFEAIHQGCEKWNEENANSEYECFYTGPASTVDQGGEAQIMHDMLGKPDTAALAISPSNAALIARTIRDANPTVPVITLDVDLAADDHGLRKTYVGADDYMIGFQMGEYIKRTKSGGGKICTIEASADAPDILRRVQGMRDSLTGQTGLAELRGEAGWTEVDGCPVFTNFDGAIGVRAMTDVLAAHPDLDVFGIMGSWPIFGAPQPYRDLFFPLADEIARGDLVIAAADPVGNDLAIVKEGLVTVLVRQRPFEMGYRAPTVMLDLIAGRQVPDPVLIDANIIETSGPDTCTKNSLACSQDQVCCNGTCKDKCD
jgi:ribose transport system substrate-binding protein